jgi:hypothetical protein
MNGIKWIVVAVTTLLMATQFSHADDITLGTIGNIDASFFEDTIGGSIEIPRGFEDLSPNEYSFSVGDMSSTQYGVRCDQDECISRHELAELLKLSLRYIEFTHGYDYRGVSLDDENPIKIIRAIQCLEKTDAGCHLINR